MLPRRSSSLIALVAATLCAPIGCYAGAEDGDYAPSDHTYADTLEGGQGGAMSPRRDTFDGISDASSATPDAAVTADASGWEGGLLPLYLPDLTVTAMTLCGNGVLDPDEACDDGLPWDVSACAPGCEAPFFERFDADIEALMERWDIPGASVAVTFEERLVLVRSYGVADQSTGEPITADSRFRLASLSKFITSAAIMTLVEAGQLELDAPAFSYLSSVPPLPGVSVDPRVEEITVRHLLNHTAGWAWSWDPLFGDRVARALGVEPPADLRQVARYVRSQPLDVDPGTRYAYSNVGYALLGLIVEDVTGLSYEEYVRQTLLEPIGASSMTLGATRRAQRLPGEVVYHGYPGEPLTTSIFADVTEPVPLSYGAWYHEGLGAAGAWVGSAVDFSRLLVALDGRPRVPDLLSPESVDTMTARPDALDWRGADSWYGMGMRVSPTTFGDTADWEHTGSLAGTGTLFVRSKHGFTWVLLTNTRARSKLQYLQAMNRTLWRAIRSVSDWPDIDRF